MEALIESINNMTDEQQQVIHGMLADSFVVSSSNSKYVFYNTESIPIKTLEDIKRYVGSVDSLDTSAVDDDHDCIEGMAMPFDEPQSMHLPGEISETQIASITNFFNVQDVKQKKKVSTRKTFVKKIEQYDASQNELDEDLSYTSRTVSYVRPGP